MVSNSVVTCVVRLYDLFHLDTQSEVFTCIYKHFIPDVDFSPNCLKIFNRYYLDYVMSNV